MEEISIPTLDGKKKDFSPCLVCGGTITKLHLQVNACHACAAFYRRSINAHTTYKCQRNDNSCNLTLKITGKPICRLCRFNRCLEIGMRISDTNFDYPDTNINEPSNYLSLSIDEIFGIIKDIFKWTVPFPRNRKIDYTEQFITLLKEFLENFKPKNDLILCCDLYNLERLNFVMKHFVASAKMLSKYSPFASLPQDIKIQLHAEFWQTFRQFERLYQTQQYFGNEIGDYRVVVDHLHFIDFSAFNNRVENPKFDFFELMMKRCLRFTDMFKKAKLTLFEFAYISQIILWSNFNLPILNESTQKRTEKITKQICDELEDYYVRQLRLSTYAGRQAQIYRLISFTNTIIYDKKETFKAQKMFVNSENKTFEYCHFEHDPSEFLEKCRIK